MKRFLLGIFMLFASMTAFAQVDTVIVKPGYRYVGQYPHGKGVLYSDSIGVYIGQVEYGIPSGIGTIYHIRGSKYHGEFRNGKPSGYGRWESPDGNIFVGDFMGGRASGIDTIYYVGQTRYYEGGTSYYAGSPIYVGKCWAFHPHGAGVRYQYVPQWGSLMMFEGNFYKGSLYNGYQVRYVKSNYGGDLVIPFAGGKALRHSVRPYEKAASAAMSEYGMLEGALKTKFPGAPLTKEQQAYLKKLKPRTSGPGDVIEDFPLASKQDSIQAVRFRYLTRATNRIDNLCQVVRIDSASRQQAIDLTFGEMIATRERIEQIKARGERRYNLTDISRPYWESMEALIPTDQMMAFKVWKKRPLNERDATPREELSVTQPTNGRKKKTKPRTSGPEDVTANFSESAKPPVPTLPDSMRINIDGALLTQATNQIDKLCKTVKMDSATRCQAIDLCYTQLEEIRELQRQRTTMSNEAYRVLDKRIRDSCWFKILRLVPPDQKRAVFVAWKNYPLPPLDAAPVKPQGQQ